MVKFGGGVDDDIESLLVDKSLEGGGDSGDRVADVKKLKKNARKPPKPPRPPKGPLILEAADRKLVRELAELAMRKRARVERIKALNKMKAAKVSSLNSGLSAMVVTLIFFLVITFQGKGIVQEIIWDRREMQRFLRWRVQYTEKCIEKLSFKSGGVNSIVQISDFNNYQGKEQKSFILFAKKL